MSSSSSFIIFFTFFSVSLAAYYTPFTPVSNAVQRRAVCLDGSPAGYFHEAGSGDGAKSWLVYLKGGGWCDTISVCLDRRNTPKGSSLLQPTYNLTGILSEREDINPDFFDWNRIYVFYCDQSSFLGDTEINGSTGNLQFRGSRIFGAVIEDLLEKGMKNAENAMLGGQSAGALAAIIHCDSFRARLPDAARVKCFSDSGFFIRAKDLPNSGADLRDRYFRSIGTLHNISSFLPMSCTKRLDPLLCLFPEYLVGDVQTPLFLLNSAFDSFQLRFSLVPPDSPKIWEMCKKGHLDNCTSTQKGLIRDYGKTLLKTLLEIPNNPSRGFFINTCFDHVFTMSSTFDTMWTPNSTLRLGIKKGNMLEAVENWYFDRNEVKVVDNITNFPQNCRVLYPSTGNQPLDQ